MKIRSRIKDSNLFGMFLEKYADKKDWEMISSKWNLSECFIEKHIDKIDWDIIIFNQNLSEPFIEKHSDRINWDMISEYQTGIEELNKLMQF